VGTRAAASGFPPSWPPTGCRTPDTTPCRPNLELGLPVDARDYGDAAEILLDLGLPTVRLLTNNPAKTARLRDCGLEVEPVPLRMAANPHNVRYLRTKRERLGHDLAEEPVPTG
jgi:3,4-dihydroxy 2-butanone 4-phosphate synthase / GTP cyclohydrolase II